MGNFFGLSAWYARIFQHMSMPAEPPKCGETGKPKHPSDCWNVRCQLGNKCCRAPSKL